jgi:hypothetical protein
MAIQTRTMAGLKNSPRTTGMVSSLKQTLCRGAQIFEQYRNNFKILGARKVTRSPSIFSIQIYKI